MSNANEQSTHLGSASSISETAGFEVFNDVTFGRRMLRRKVNTRLPDIASASEASTIDVLCECGRRLCADRLQLTVDAYEAVLESPGHYVVTTSHEHDPGQSLVSRHHGFVVVERDGH